MENFILALVLAVIVGGAATYLYRAKKRGQTCVGCPHAGTCGSSKCTCGSDKK